MINLGLAILTVGVLYAVFFVVPPAEGLGYLVRIIFFHIPFAWVSVIAFFFAAWKAWKYLSCKDLRHDAWSSSSAFLGFLFSILATISGAIFAKLTWGAYWNWDPRQTSIFVLLLIYGAYLSLRCAIEDEGERAKTASVYALLSCVTVPFLVFVIPRFYSSLHPEPVLNSSGRIDMDSVMLGVLLASTVACTLFYRQLLVYMAGRKIRKIQNYEYEKEAVNSCENDT